MANMRLLIVLACCLLFGACQPQSEEINSEQSDVTAEVDSLFDEEAALRRAKERIRRVGVPTPAQVDSLRVTATSLFNAGDCGPAVDTLKRYAEKANWLSNLIEAGLEPFYSASYDDRQQVGRTRIRELVPYESQINKLRRQRNAAYVMIAECLIKTGEVEEATAYYFNSLDLISVQEDTLWDRARSGLYDLLDVE